MSNIPIPSTQVAPGKPHSAADILTLVNFLHSKIYIDAMPPNPVSHTGQLWYDWSTYKLRQWNGSVWEFVDKFVCVSGMDTDPAFLSEKLVAGSNMSFEILDPGGNEQLRLNSTGGGGSIYYGDPVNIRADLLSIPSPHEGEIRLVKSQRRLFAYRSTPYPDWYPLNKIFYAADKVSMPNPNVFGDAYAVGDVCFVLDEERYYYLKDIGGSFEWTPISKLWVVVSDVSLPNPVTEAQPLDTCLSLDLKRFYVSDNGAWVQTPFSKYRGEFDSSMALPATENKDYDFAFTKDFNQLFVWYSGQWNTFIPTTASNSQNLEWQAGSFYLNRNNHIGTQEPNTIFPQGSSSGLDADMIDGKHLSEIVTHLREPVDLEVDLKDVLDKKVGDVVYVLNEPGAEVTPFLWTGSVWVASRTQYAELILITDVLQQNQYERVRLLDANLRVDFPYSYITTYFYFSEGQPYYYGGGGSQQGLSGWRRAEAHLSVIYNELTEEFIVVNRSVKAREYKIVIGKKWR